MNEGEAVILAVQYLRDTGYLEQLVRDNLAPAVAGAIAEHGRMFPMQGGPAIPWPLAQAIYAGYSAMHGKQQSLERLAERGGFGWGEVEFFYKDRVGRPAIEAAMQRTYPQPSRHAIGKKP